MITPQQSYPPLAKAVGVSSLWLKREDKHPYGSHKGRSIPVMIDEAFKKGKHHFAISSSGNAALAAAMHVKELNRKKTSVTPAEAGVLELSQDSRFRGNDKQSKKIKLEILVGNHILEKKLKKLSNLCDDNISVMRFERPLMTLTQKTADGSVQSLRQSTDDEALVGYVALARELEEIDGLQAVFVATSSGTTAQALAQYFLNNKVPVEVHIVQTTSHHPMAGEFVNSVPNDEESVADAIVDITAHRKEALVPLVEKTGGSGWVVTNEEILTAQQLIENEAGIKVSPNGALALAGLMQATFTGREWKGPVVCVVGGE